jgi:hypothetical protein
MVDLSICSDITSTPGTDSTRRKLIPVLADGQADQYNPIYRGEAGAVFAKNPNQLLVEAVRNKKPGTGLDVGMGQGRNSIFSGAATTEEAKQRAIAPRVQRALKPGGLVVVEDRHLDTRRVWAGGNILRQ